MLGDSNADLIGAYRLVRDNVDAVYEAVKQWKPGREEYYRVRSLDAENLSTIDRAARFIYLNRYCFNGLYRTNSQGQFNVPWGASRAGALPSLGEFRVFAESLHSAKLVVGDFACTLRGARPGHFVYLDPPCRVSERRVFREYGALGFGIHDLKRLRRSLLSLNHRGIDFVLSYVESSEARFLARGFTHHSLNVKRFIAGSSQKRTQAKEVLITNIKVEAS